MDYTFLKQNKIIPVIKIDSLDETVPKLASLHSGGINIAEITFRTEAALCAINMAVETFPNMIIGAGTVINEAQCEEAVKAGAKFIVSPGLDESVATYCKKNDIPYLPGIVTPTEIIKAKGMGFKILKFFPAEAMGGIKTLEALSSAFPDIKFLPTGGVNQNNFIEYLKQKYIIAIGGSWMMKGDTAEISKLTKEAVANLMEMKL